MGHVVYDSDREVTAGSFLVELVEDCLHHRRSKLLRREAIAAGDDSRFSCQGGNAFGPRLAERSHDVEIEWISRSPRLLGSIQHGETASAPRQCCQERGGRERTIKAYLEDTHSLAASNQVLHGFVHGLGTRAHDHDDALGFRVA